MYLSHIPESHLCVTCIFRSLQTEHGVVHHFGPSAASLLAKHLTHTQLPGLSSLDQMYLLALADTVANTKLEFSDSTDHKGTNMRSIKIQIYQSDNTYYMIFFQCYIVPVTKSSLNCLKSIVRCSNGN